MAGCAHATTLVKLALVDSVDHNLKKLPSLSAAFVCDTRFQAVGKSHQVSQQLQRAIDLFTKHAEEVLGPVVCSKKLEIITNDERVRTDVRNNTVHGRSPHTLEELGLRLRRGAHGRQGRGDASKVVLGQDDLPRLRQAGARVARLVNAAAAPSLVCGSDVTGMPPAQLNEKFCREKTHHHCLDLDLILEDAGNDPADVVPRLPSSCGTVRWSSDGSLRFG